LLKTKALINRPFATSAFPSQADVCSVTAVLRQPLTASLHPPPAALRRSDPRATLVGPITRKNKIFKF
jgi:hypothetical protein